jgi:BolA protein
MTSGEGLGQDDERLDSEWSPGSVAKSIEIKLTARFTPQHLEIEDESHRHAGHAGVSEASRKGETHFKVTIVSSAFEGLSLIDRHRAVNACLQKELSNGVHALSIKAKTTQ